MKIRCRKAVWARRYGVGRRPQGTRGDGGNSDGGNGSDDGNGSDYGIDSDDGNVNRHGKTSRRTGRAGGHGRYPRAMNVILGYTHSAKQSQSGANPRTHSIYISSGTPHNPSAPGLDRVMGHDDRGRDTTGTRLTHKITLSLTDAYCQESKKI